MADLHIDDELRVTQTTPQGSQEDAVEHGHEERDANVGSIMKWLIGVGVFAAATLVGIVILYNVLTAANANRYATPTLYVEQKKPVLPAIEGLVIGGVRAGMTEHLAAVREREATYLNRWGMKVPTLAHGPSRVEGDGDHSPQGNGATGGHSGVDESGHVQQGGHQTEQGHGHNSADMQSQVLPTEFRIEITDAMVAEVTRENPRSAGSSAGAGRADSFWQGGMSDSSGGLKVAPTR
jgi:hypothetical protein